LFVQLAAEACQTVLDGEVQADQPPAVRVGQRRRIALPHGFDDVQRGMMSGSRDAAQNAVEMVQCVRWDTELVLQEPPPTVGTVPAADEVQRVVEGGNVLD